jgi:hypothetical protein
MKIHHVAAELFHVDGQTDGQTDMTKLTVAFSNFANAPNNTHRPALTLVTETDGVLCEVRTEAVVFTLLFRPRRPLGRVVV